MWGGGTAAAPRAPSAAGAEVSRRGEPRPAARRWRCKGRHPEVIRAVMLEDGPRVLHDQSHCPAAAALVR